MAAETFKYSGEEEASGSYALPLLVVAALGLLGYAGVRLRHYHLRRRREALWRRQDAVWEATVRQIEMRRAIGALKPSAERLQKLDVG